LLIQDAPTSLVTYEPYATLSLRVAEEIKEQIKNKPDSRLGLPTGRTPTDTYRVLSRWTKEGDIDWAHVKTFGLDEYYGVEESTSFRHYLETNLYRNINLPAESRFSPIFNDDYDVLIAREGGLDLAILGIGPNGHIAFNEPGTPLQSYTHSIWLSESTRQANAEFFKGEPPTNAVTMGIQTILNSRKIILMASGKSKKEILQRALRGEVTPEVPASFLQLHKDLVVMTDFEY
jgi:glucosamine-6-phosphate deaminase